MKAISKLKLITLGSLFLLFSCSGKRTSYYVTTTEEQEDTLVSDIPNEKDEINSSFSVAYKTMEGVKTVHVKLNDAASFDAIFDTGCSGMLISLQEALSLVKSGTLTQEDRLENQSSSIASGEVVENQVFRLHEITLMDTNGKPHTVHNVPVTVMENPGAAVLVGNFVIDQLAEYAYTIDLKNHTIVFQ